MPFGGVIGARGRRGKYFCSAECQEAGADLSPEEIEWRISEAARKRKESKSFVLTEDDIKGQRLNPEAPVLTSRSRVGDWSLT
jgi:hypothetical protein